MSAKLPQRGPGQRPGSQPFFPVRLPFLYTQDPTYMGGVVVPKIILWFHFTCNLLLNANKKMLLLLSLYHIETVNPDTTYIHVQYYMLWLGVLLGVRSTFWPYVTLTFGG